MDLEKSIEEKKITSKMFLLFFFFFKFFILNYIFTYYQNNNHLLDNLNIRNFLLEKNNNIVFLRFYYICNYLIYNNWLIKIKEINIYILIEMILKKINFISFNYKFLYKKKKNKIYFDFDFFLRIELIFLLRYKYFMEYFRFFKYKEYLTLHPNLLNYTNLKKFLLSRIIKKMKKKKKQQINDSLIVLYLFKIYNAKIIYVKNNYYRKLLNLNIKLNNHNFFKFNNFLINNEENLYKWWLFINTNNRLIYFYFLHNIWIYQKEEDDWHEIKKFRIDTLDQLNWQLNRYYFRPENWFYFLFMLKIWNIYLYKNSNIINYIIIPEINLWYRIKNKKIQYCWYKILTITLMVYIDKLFFKFFETWSELRRKIMKKKTWAKVWFILKRYYTFEWLKITTRNYKRKNLYFFLKLNKNSLDNICWNIFFSGQIKQYSKLNITTIISKIEIDNYLWNKFENLNTLFTKIYQKKIKFEKIKEKKHNYLIYIYLFEYFYNFLLRNKYIKFNKFFYFHYILINLLKYNENKKIYYNIEKQLSRKIFMNYYEINKNSYIYRIEKNIILYIYFFYFINIK